MHPNFHEYRSLLRLAALAKPNYGSHTIWLDPNVLQLWMGLHVYRVVLTKMR